MRVVDAQWHWYPSAFFRDVAGRSEFPRCRITAEEFRLQVGPDDELPFGIRECKLETQIEAMDVEGVDAIVASPGSLTVEAFPGDEPVRLAKLLNAEMASAETRYPGRVVGSATVPFTTPNAALDVLEHAVTRLGLRVMWLPSNVLGRLIDVEKFRRLFERLAELDVVAVIHPVRTISAEKLDRYGLEYVVGYPFDTSLAALTLVLSGLMEALPGLKVLHPHLGGALPYLASRIDREYVNPWAGNEPLASLPSHYLRRFYTDTVSESPEGLALALEFYGADRVLFGSDHPWWPVEAGIEFVMRNTSGKVRAAVMSENADALFGLDR
jgi:aminocarboxymuconate-semialdehyde decarboxylase